jgi:hypothetical protein
MTGGIAIPHFSANPPLVPALTRSNGIKLNKRVSLRRHLHALLVGALHVAAKRLEVPRQSRHAIIFHLAACSTKLNRK